MRAFTREACFGGGIVQAQVRFVDLRIPEGCDLIGGMLFRRVYDPVILGQIVYPDGSHPTGCALLPARPDGSLVGFSTIVDAD